MELFSKQDSITYFPSLKFFTCWICPVSAKKSKEKNLVLLLILKQSDLILVP